MTPSDTLSPFPACKERAEWNELLNPFHVPKQYRKCIACICNQHGIHSPTDLKRLLELHRSPDGMRREFQGFESQDFADYFRGVHDKVEYLLELPVIFPSSESSESYYG